MALLVRANAAFLKDQFRSDLRVSEVTAPVLVVHGEDDIAFGERLDGLVRALKRFVRIAGVGHKRSRRPGGGAEK